MYIASNEYLNIMYNPLSYTDPGRFKCNQQMLDTAYGRSVANNIIIEQFQLSTGKVELTTPSVFFIKNWALIRDIVFYTGCQVLRGDFFQQGRFMSLPEPARNFIKTALIPVDIRYPRTTFDGSHDSIISTGYAVFMPAVSILPLPLRQRITICFPPYVEEEPFRQAVTPLFISMVTRYAKKNPLKLFI
ncbi:hypothetical protein [Enterobacter ludwigii]|uniref:hypothetical protein n=1 Tax=Enterobacter ludwigii TaxID=299767 RepID=UPI003976CD65